MPTCKKVTLASITDWENLCESAVRAARGKRHRESVQRYFKHFEKSTTELQRVLMKGRLPAGTYRQFCITDPKPRLIHAAPFEDRVAHHAIIACMAERFECAWVDSSYACRSGKGSHAAVLKAQRLAQRYPYLLKMDVHSYFACVEHETLLCLLNRLFKGDEFFNLLRNILGSFSTSQGTGLPIGALTSQYFANHYLDGFQRMLQGHPLVKAEMRYMDDCLVACDSSRAARAIANDSNCWLDANRKLTLKTPLIQRSSVGLPFCGFRIRAGELRLGRRRVRSITRHYKQVANSYSHGELSERQLQKRIHSIVALGRPAQQGALMKSLLDKCQLDSLC